MTNSTKRTIRPLANDRNKRRTQRKDGMPRLLCKPVPHSVRSGSGIGHSAAGNDNAICRISRFRRTQNTAQLSLFYPKRLYRFLPDADPRAPHISCQRIDDIDRPIGHRKHPVSTFCFERDAALLEKSNRIVRAELGNGAIQKAPVRHNIRDNLLRRAVIGHIAPTLARNHQLSSRTGIFF